MNKQIGLHLLFWLCITLLMVVIIFTSKPRNMQIRNDYPQLDETCIINYTTADDVIDILNSNKSAIIVYGFKKCPWCQQAIKYINEIAIEKGYKEVLYLDIYDMRNNEDSLEHDKYLTIFNLIKMDIGNPEKIFAPTVTTVKAGKVVSYHVATVDSHQINEDHILPPMTEEEIEALKKIYREIF